MGVAGRDLSGPFEVERGELQRAYELLVPVYDWFLGA